MEAIGSFIPLIAIIAIMYFLMIRPQMQQRKAHEAMVQALRRGDEIVTAGGLFGKVTKVRVVRSTIARVVNKTEPASE